jgi:hypothetical protein
VLKLTPQVKEELGTTGVSKLPFNRRFAFAGMAAIEAAKMTADSFDSCALCMAWSCLSYSNRRAAFRRGWQCASKAYPRKATPVV